MNIFTKKQLFKLFGDITDIFDINPSERGVAPCKELIEGCKKAIETFFLLGTAKVDSDQKSPQNLEAELLKRHSTLSLFINAYPKTIRILHFIVDCLYFLPVESVGIGLEDADFLPEGIYPNYYVENKEIPWLSSVKEEDLFILEVLENLNGDILKYFLFQNRIEEISQALKSLLLILEDRLHYLTNNIIWFGKISESYKKSLAHYLDMASYIQEGEDTKKLIAKLETIHLENYGNKNFTTFLFICSPSGTGKTNMVFAFERPFLYFLYYPDCQQDIYRCFQKQSEELGGLFSNDYKLYTKTFPNVRITVENVVACGLKFASVGFLVSMIMKLDTLWRSSSCRNSGRIQSSIESCWYQEMSLKTAKTALKEYFQTANYFFPIIFDECSLQFDDELDWPPQYQPGNYLWNGIDQAKFFCFIRSIVRSMKCPPIFMGTNARAANFLGFAVGSDSGTVDLEPWSVVWVRPPNLVPSLVEDSIGLIRGKKADLKLEFPSNQLISFLGKYLAKERPLFLHYAINFLNYYFENHRTLNINSDEQLLRYLLEDVLSEYRFRKGSPNLFNCGQLSYFAAGTWGTIKANESSSVHMNTDLYIHRHLGYLHVRPDEPTFPKYATLTTRKEGAIFIRQYYKKPVQDFKIISHFDTFKAAPMTGLICSGISSDYSCILAESFTSNTLPLMPDNQIRKKFEFKRLSIMKALYNSFTGVGISVTDYEPRNTSFKLESLLQISVMVASHCNGFKGCTFKQFVNNLIRELRFDSVYQDASGESCKASEVGFPEEFPSTYLNMVVPFAAPMASDSWPADMGNDLIDLFGAKLGYIRPPVIHSPGDVELYYWPQEKAALIGECKMYSYPVSAHTLRAIITTKFSKYPECLMFIVSAPSFTSMDSFYDEKYCIWRIANAVKIEPIDTKTPQKQDAEKHVILIALNRIYSIDERKKLFELIKIQQKLEKPKNRKEERNRKQTKMIRVE